MFKSFIKHYFWFWKESFSLMEGYNKFYIVWGCIRKAHGFAIGMAKWDKMTPEQREQWYLSGEGRVFEI